MEQIKAMFEAMANDKAFSEEIAVLIKGGKTAEIITMAKKKGFEITEAEWQAYLKWGETVTPPPSKGELSEEELEIVSGGEASGFPWDPIIGNCWFHAASEATFRDGAQRKRCNQFACKAYVNGTYGKADDAWYQCGCWGTDKCIGNWHYEQGC